MQEQVGHAGSGDCEVVCRCCEVVHRVVRRVGCTQLCTAHSIPPCCYCPLLQLCAVVAVPVQQLAGQSRAAGLIVVAGPRWCCCSVSVQQGSSWQHGKQLVGRAQRGACMNGCVMHHSRHVHTPCTALQQGPSPCCCTQAGAGRAEQGSKAYHGSRAGPRCGWPPWCCCPALLWLSWQGSLLLPPGCAQQLLGCELR